jgi:hypothetical protein
MSTKSKASYAMNREMAIDLIRRSEPNPPQ